MKEFDRFSFPRNYSGKVPLIFRKFPEKFRSHNPISNPFCGTPVTTDHTTLIHRPVVVVVVVVVVVEVVVVEVVVVVVVVPDVEGHRVSRYCVTPEASNCLSRLFGLVCTQQP